jgi:hypothetical protein
MGLKFVLRALHDIVGQKTVGQWEIFGSFINERQTIPWDHGLLIELDKTTVSIVLRK